MVFFFWLCQIACGISVPGPGIELAPLALETWSPNHWTTREVAQDMNFCSISGWLSCLSCVQVTVSHGGVGSDPTPDVTVYSFPGGAEGKESACNAGDPGSIPGLGRSPGEGNDNSLQYSCMENSMDKRACWATVQGSQKVTQLSS